MCVHVLKIKPAHEHCFHKVPFILEGTQALTSTMPAGIGSSSLRLLGNNAANTVAPLLYLLDKGVPSWDRGYRCLALWGLPPRDPAERPCGNSFLCQVSRYLSGLGGERLGD